MRALLDVNVLIALLDADHTLHRQSMAWFAGHAKQGWASCPITQNGCVRILSSPGYPNPLPAPLVIARLSAACADEVHAFWFDDVSVLDDDLIDGTLVHGPRQLTDVYLLALAVRHGGRFVTFDRSIPTAAVHGFKPRHLVNL